MHWSSTRSATLRQVIELESQLDQQRRPSVTDCYDTRTLPMKVADWLRMWIKSPRDAARLPFIDRHPPMVWWDYDDSDDLSARRWLRALATPRNKFKLTY